MNLDDPFERPRPPYWWFFGEPWGAPICEDYEQGATPVGSQCAHCDQRIEKGDQGLVQPFADGDGVWPIPQHIECAMCSVASWCPCNRLHRHDGSVQ